MEWPMFSLAGDRESAGGGGKSADSEAISIKTATNPDKTNERNAQIKVLCWDEIIVVR